MEYSNQKESGSKLIRIGDAQFGTFSRWTVDDIHLLDCYGSCYTDLVTSLCLLDRHVGLIDSFDEYNEDYLANELDKYFSRLQEIGIEITQFNFSYVSGTRSRYEDEEPLPGFVIGQVTLNYYRASCAYSFSIDYMDGLSIFTHLWDSDLPFYTRIFDELLSGYVQN